MTTMKSMIYNYIQRQSLRLSLCAIALTACSVAYAQDDVDAEEESTGFKAPKRTQVVDNNPTCNVQGIVFDDATKLPLAGVRIQALNDKRYVAMTDDDGKFFIKVPTFTTALFVQTPTYLSQQVSIKPGDEQQRVSIYLLSDAFATMYADGTTITAQNSFVSNGNGLSIDEEMTAKLGGDIRMNMHSGNLEQGAAMFIRGISSLNGNAQPLVILDGVELDMQQSRSSLHLGDIFNMLSTISPEDIDKVTVLKNATALYGARGANGVIIIDTKRGHSMATRIDAKLGVGWTFTPSYPKMMNAAQYRNYAVEQLGTIAEVQNRIGSSTNPLQFNFLNDAKDGYYYNTYHNDTDWSKYVYRTALTHNYSINVQGGDDVGMYNLSVAYIQTMKNIKSTSFDRINVRFNTDIRLLWNLTTKFDMSFSRTNTNLFDDGIAEDLNSGVITSPAFLSLIKSPLLNPYQYNKNINAFTSLLADADDLYSTLKEGNYSQANPLALMRNGNGERKNRNENTFFNVAIAPTYEINSDWSVTSHFSYYLNRNSQAYYRPNIGMPSFAIKNLGTVYSKTASIFSKEINVLSNTHVDWKKKIGAHTIAATGGFRYTYFSYDNSDLSTQYSTKGEDDKNPKLATGNDVYDTVAGVDDVWKNMQWYASGDYNYINKYFATVSLLAEANSRFGSNANGGVKLAGVKWAIFPSVQLGWVLSNEDWFPKNAGINYLRLNAGFDMSGNDDISNYAARTSFNSVRFNYQEIGTQLTNVGNEEIKWETTSKFNIGLQANFLHNRLGFNANYFIHNTKDLLALKSFENPIGGINNYWTNDGELRNTGFEVGINGKPISLKDWHLEIGATVGHYKNEVKALANGNYTSSIYGKDNILTSVGNPVGVFYGYKTKGVFSTTADAQAAALYLVDETGAQQYFQAGDVIFDDLNDDHQIDERDKTIIGDPNPDIYGNIFLNLNWKRFTLGMTFNYSLGNDVYNYQRSILNSGSTLYNQQVAEIAHWRYEGQQTSLPRLNYGDPMGNNRFSDRWIEDGSYLRMKSVMLTYQVPMPDSWQSWLQGISVWAEGRNLFTLTKYTGSDPEFAAGNNQLYQGIDCGTIAQGRIFSMGVKINL
ncbi:TonB-linked outer membrane protein, SusC/RagA family [Prevotella communis]|uniref:TonB-linked outer membrane protein, SusC/RagA family n=2 Tax=Prevotella communis TaxID=2913614 RepID=A0A1G7YG14_9BACT|nr:TonB-linked outer membrane protein, SusC/RagA family [Prevotella communis]